MKNSIVLTIPFPDKEPQDPDDWEAALPSTYPPALKKATYDEFTYAAQLASGVIFRFTRASAIDAEWVHLSGITDLLPNPHRFIQDRGMDVRVDQLAWVADAPDGS